MKNSKQTIDEFVALKTLAVVGVSRNKDKFGSTIYRELKAKGYKVFAVNPEMDMFEGDRCYAGLGALPEKPEGVIFSVQPAITARVLQDMPGLGIQYAWIQQGANSPEIEAKATELGLNSSARMCVYVLPSIESIHKFHRTVIRSLD
jgi:predicted CoA-binding protein